MFKESTLIYIFKQLNRINRTSRYPAFHLTSKLQFQNVTIEFLKYIFHKQSENIFTKFAKHATGHSDKNSLNLQRRVLVGTQLEGSSIMFLFFTIEEKGILRTLSHRENLHLRKLILTGSSFLAFSSLFLTLVLTSANIVVKSQRLVTRTQGTWLTHHTCLFCY